MILTPKMDMPLATVPYHLATVPCQMEMVMKKERVTQRSPRLIDPCYVYLVLFLLL